MKEKIDIKKEREERKRHALNVALDDHRDPQHFWDALLISDIDHMIDSIEGLQGNIGSVEMAIEGASRSANRLASKIKKLTWVMKIASIIGLAIGAYAAFFK